MYTIILACCFLTTASLQLPTIMKDSTRVIGYVDHVMKNTGFSKPPHNDPMVHRKAVPRPFVIEQVKSPESDKESHEISQLVISVFFDEEAEKNQVERTFDVRDIFT